VSPSRPALVEDAPAKINLTLRVLGRRRDGYHDLASLVAFARLHDRLEFLPGPRLTLAVRGPAAAYAGSVAGNLVLKAARALALEIDGLALGSFTLEKNLPVAAGLGGGSSDAAAALRLLARANRLKSNDARIRKIARTLGADVPICLDPHPRIMRGIGEKLSDRLRIPRFPMVLVNPAAKLSTADVFARFDRLIRPRLLSRLRTPAVPRQPKAFVAMLAAEPNDLEPAAMSLVPAIAHVLESLRNMPECLVAKMSGSGATCFGLFPSSRAASVAARKISAAHPRWWVRATSLI
jgi:4-diphosphocytidyl-2-C-methyl-D-erythritol kinase